MTARTIPELGVEIRELRRELRGYVDTHEREHTRIDRAHERMDGTMAGLRKDVQANTDHHTREGGQWSVIKWLIGTNLAVLVALLAAILALLRDSHVIA